MKKKSSKLKQPPIGKKGKTPPPKKDNQRKKPTARERKAVAEKIKAAVTPKKGVEPPKPVVVDQVELPKGTHKTFGGLPFAEQAKLLFGALPAQDGEIIGGTEKSGPGDFTFPAPPR